MTPPTRASLHRCAVIGCNTKTWKVIGISWFEPHGGGSGTHRLSTFATCRDHKSAVLKAFAHDTGRDDFNYVVLKISEVAEWYEEAGEEARRLVEEHGGTLSDHARYERH